MKYGKEEINQKSKTRKKAEEKGIENSRSEDKELVKQKQGKIKKFKPNQDREA